MAEMIPDPHGEDPVLPRWVLALGIIAAVLLVLFVVVHLAGGGFRGHMAG